MSLIASIICEPSLSGSIAHEIMSPELNLIFSLGVFSTPKVLEDLEVEETNVEVEEKDDEMVPVIFELEQVNEGGIIISSIPIMYTKKGILWKLIVPASWTLF